ncbi:MAG: metalloregulator ArsR/SmtB family transcription factor [Myxococcota bacterium]|nr:metalloregulator ArsR/SmtB family transcription factor [Myxococcota bacterium]
MRELVDIHKALADETRIRILSLLMELGELCVCDVETGLDITQSRASRHMTQLRQAGLVEDRRDGQWVYYRIAESLAPAAAHALTGLREAREGDAELARDVKATKKARRSPCR